MSCGGHELLLLLFLVFFKQNHFPRLGEESHESFRRRWVAGHRLRYKSSVLFKSLIQPLSLAEDPFGVVIFRLKSFFLEVLEIDLGFLVLVPPPLFDGVRGLRLVTDRAERLSTFALNSYATLGLIKRIPQRALRRDGRSDTCRSPVF